MSQTIQIKRATSVPSTLSLYPGEFAIGGKKLYVGAKTDSLAPGSETKVTPIRILSEEDYTSLSNIAGGKTTAYVVAETPASLTSGNITTINNKTIALSSLKIGDYVLVIKSGVPDYFWTGSALAPIEVDKSLLDGYITEVDADAKYELKSEALSKQETIEETYATKAALTDETSARISADALKMDKSNVVRMISNTNALVITDPISWTATKYDTAVSQWIEGAVPNSNSFATVPTAFDITYIYARLFTLIGTNASYYVHYSDIVDTPSSATDKVLSAKGAQTLQTNINALSTSKLNKSSVVDGLESSDSSVPLSARQGNVLNGKFETLSSDLNELEANLNTLVTKIDGGLWA